MKQDDVKVGMKFTVLKDECLGPKYGPVGAVWVLTKEEPKGMFHAIQTLPNGTVKPEERFGGAYSIWSCVEHGALKLKEDTLRCTCGKHDVPVDTTDFYTAHRLHYQGLTTDESILEHREPWASLPKPKPRKLREDPKLSIEEQW